MSSFLLVLQAVAATFTAVLVLLHAPKGDGIASIGGAGQMFRSTSNRERSLNIATWIFAVIFLCCSALLGWGLV